MREKHQSAASPMLLDWGLNPQSRHVPWSGIELVTLCFSKWYPTKWAAPVGAIVYSCLCVTSFTQHSVFEIHSIIVHVSGVFNCSILFHCMNISQFIHDSVNQHLSYFQFLSLWTKHLWTFFWMTFVGHRHSFLLSGADESQVRCPFSFSTLPIFQKGISLYSTSNVWVF